MYLPVSWRIEGVTEGEARLEGISARAADLQAPLTRIGGSLIAGFEKQFASEGAYASTWPYPGAGPWRPLTDRYRRWKERHYPGRKILVATGTMKDRAIIGGGKSMVIGPHSLHYTPANAPQTRRYEYKRVNYETWKRARPEDRSFNYGYLVRSPHARTVDMAHIAYFHQVGAGNNPRRPPVVFNMAEVASWDMILRDWLDGRAEVSARIAA